MDIFSSFMGQDDDLVIIKSRTKAPLVERSGLAIRLHKSSLLFFDDNAQTEIFVPYTQIRDFWFTGTGSKLSARKIEDIEPDDEITILIPVWLARKEGLV